MLKTFYIFLILQGSFLYSLAVIPNKSAEAIRAEEYYLQGMMYYSGSSVVKDSVEAVKWLRYAAAEGHVKAQYNLGVIYTKGEGVDKDLREAAKWFYSAAEQNYPKAQYYLGLFYGKGYGLSQSNRQAAKYLVKAANHFDTQDYYSQAVTWCLRAAEGGDIFASSVLGDFYSHGHGVSKNLSKASQWYRKTAELYEKQNNHKQSILFYNKVLEYNKESINSVGQIKPGIVPKKNQMVVFPAVDRGLDPNPRDRMRELDKRNPMASEYQAVGGVGVVSYVNSDAEGVNFHGRLPSGGILDGPIFRVNSKASYHYGNLSKAGVWQGNISVNQVFGEDHDWALLFDLDTQAADLEYERIYTRWGTIDLGDGPQNVIERLNTGRRIIHQRRKSFKSVLEHALSERHTLFFKTSLSQTKDSDIAQRFERRFVEGEYEEVSDLFAFSSGASVKREIRDDPQQTYIYRFEGGGKIKDEDWGIKYSFYFSDYERSRPDQFSIEFRREDIDMSYDRQDINFPHVTIHDDLDIYDPDKMLFREANTRSSTTIDKDYAGDINFYKRFNFSKTEMEFFLGSLYRQKERTNQDERHTYENFNGNYLLSQSVVQIEPNLIAENHYRLGRGIDPYSSRMFFSDNFEDFELNYGRSRAESDPNNYRSYEEVNSMFIMQRFKTPSWHFNAGFRYEKTTNETDGNTLIFDDEGEYLDTMSVSNKNEYNNTFFTAEFIYFLTEQINLRVAGFETIARPNYFHLVPFRRVFYSSEFIWEGNPDLQSTEFINFVLGLDVKNSFTGNFSVAGYYKDIENFFFFGNSFRVGGSFDGFKIGRVENGEEANIWGIEFGWNRNIPILSQVLGNTTANIFYIYSNSEAKTSFRQGEIFPLPERANHMLDLALLNEIGKFKTRIGLTFQSASLTRIAENANADRYINNEMIINLSSKYQMNDQINLFADFFNITEQPQNNFEGDAFRPTDRIFSSWRARVGLNITL